MNNLINEFKEISADNYKVNPFEKIGKQWMLITAGNKEKCNAMTASWGGLGVLWNKNVAFIFIRHTRYTKEFVDNNESLSLCFLDEKYRKQLNYFGTVSGREENKIEKCGFNVCYSGETPYFAEASEVIIANKLYVGEIEENSFLDKTLIDKCYKQRDFHSVYVCEIKKILSK